MHLSVAQLKQRLLLALTGLLGCLPLALLYRLSDGLFLLLYRGFGFQRRILDDNLQRAFPDLTPDKHAQLAERAYRNALDFLFEAIKAWRLDADALRRRVRFSNPELMESLVAEHGTVIALTSHYGNWEWLLLGAGVQIGPQVAVPYRSLNQPLIDAQLVKLRSRFGGLPVNARTELPRLNAFAKRGGIIALNADQLPRPEEDKAWHTLLGQDTAFYTGPERLARLYRAPAVFVNMQRLQRGYYEVSFELLRAPPYRKDTGILPAYVDALERQIRHNPEGWFWLYKRWKYPPPRITTQT